MTEWTLDESLLVYKSALSDSETAWKSSRKMNGKQKFFDDKFIFDPAEFQEKDDKRERLHKQFASGCCKDSNNNKENSPSKAAFQDHYKKNAADKEKKAILAMTQQRFYEAALFFSEAIACDPGRAINFIKRCTCSIALGQYKQAVADALNAIKLDKHNRVPYYKLLDCHLATGDLDSAEDVLETFLKIVPKARVKQAVMLMKLRELKGDIDAAFLGNQLGSCLELIDEALVIAPACPDLRFLKARCFVASNTNNPANQSSIDPKIVEMLKLYYNGDFDNSFVALQSLPSKCKRLLAFEKTFDDIILGLQKAEKLVDRKNYVAAIDKLQSMVAFDPTNNNFLRKLHWLTASAHFLDKRFVLAIKFADQSLEIDVNFYEANVLKAECFFEMKNYEKSLEALEKVLLSCLVSTAQKDEALQLKAKVEVEMRAQQSKADFRPPPKSAEEKSEKPKKCKSTYSTDDVRKEKVDNSQFFSNYFEEKPEPSKREPSTYSFSSADTKANPKFKEFVGKPKEKSETKTFKQIQDEMRAQKMNQHGNKEFSNGSYRCAIKSYSDAIAILPKYPIFYNNRAACYMKIEEFELAAADAVRGIELDALNWKSYSKAINCFLLIGNINQAENYIEKLQKNIPAVESIKFDEIPKLKRLKLLNEKISQCFVEKFFEDCLTSLEEALKIAKFSIKYRDYKIQCLIMLNRIPEADLMIDQIFQKNPKHAKMFYLKGLKFYQLGELETCIDQLETCLRIDPDLKPAQDLRSKAKKIWELYQKGFELYRSQIYCDAKDAFESALKIDDFSSRFRLKLFFNIGAANCQLSKFATAKQNFTEALRINETHVKALTRRADCHFKLKEFEDCIIDCEEVMRLEPSEDIRKLISDAKFSVSVSKGCNHYTILGISTDPTESEIKKAFHRLSLLYHSDKNPKATAVEKKKLERKFQQVKEAYNFAMSLL